MTEEEALFIAQSIVRAEEFRHTWPGEEGYEEHMEALRAEGMGLPHTPCSRC